jgi:hypothetical protein
LILSPWLESLVRSQGPTSLGEWCRRHGAQPGQGLTLAADRGWMALELTLAGDPVWDRLSVVLHDAEDQALIPAARSACDALPPELMPRLGEDFRRRCLADLWRARRLGLICPVVPALHTWADDLSRLGDPAHRPHAERHALTGLAGELVHGGCPYLTELLTASDWLPLPVAAGRSFLRRAAGEDAALAASLGQPADAQTWPDADRLWPLLARHGDTVAALLDEVRGAAEGDHLPALDLFEEWRGRGEGHLATYEAVWDVQRRLGLLRTRPRSADAAVVRDGASRQAVKQAVARYRALPEDQRHDRPALLNAVAKLHLAGGDFRAAGKDFTAAAALTADPAVQAEVFANAHRAFLEARDTPAALQALLTAAHLDPRRHAPFPVDRLTPTSVLAADDGGVTFLCRRQPGGDTVVVRSLAAEALGRDAEALFAEYGVVRTLNHPAILGVQECGFADPVAKRRPYLVLEHFEGTTLRKHVEKHGVLTPEELLAVARQAAEGLRALHGRSVVHGDLTPCAIFVRRETKPKLTWEVRLAGLGLSPSRDAATDMEGFGRACCFALFKTPQPTPAQWTRVPAALADLLRSCTAADPATRPADFNALLTSLRQVSTRPVPPPRQAAPPPKPQPPPNPLSPPRTRPPRVRVRPPFTGGGGPNPRVAGGVIGVIALVMMGVVCGFLRSGGSSSGPSYKPPIHVPSYQYQPVQVPKWDPPPAYDPPRFPTVPPDNGGVYGGYRPSDPSNPLRPGGGSFSGGYAPDRGYGPGGVPNPNQPGGVNGSPQPNFGGNPPSPWR